MHDEMDLVTALIDVILMDNLNFVGANYDELPIELIVVNFSYHMLSLRGIVIHL